jgi:hypothetical protein
MAQTPEDMERLAVMADLRIPRFVHNEILFATQCGNMAVQNAIRRLDRSAFFDCTQGDGPRFYSARDAFFLAAFGDITRRGVSPNTAAAYAKHVRDFGTVDMAGQFKDDYRELYQLWFAFIGPHVPEPLHAPAGELEPLMEIYPAALIVNVTKILRDAAGRLRQALDRRVHPEAKT